MKDGVAHVQAGGGIVYDSDPATEYPETENKAMALLRAQGVHEIGLGPRVLRVETAVVALLARLAA